MDDAERIAALAELARDILELYEDSHVTLIHVQSKSQYDDDMNQFSFMHALDGYRARIEELAGDA
jgi:hypothetical protein